MTCMVPVREGMTIASQNTLGSRDVDLLRVSDWFFPQGVNHHELWAGVPGAQTVMQAFARRVAGLGLLPEAEVKTRGAVRRRLDAVVIGAGPSGMAIGAALLEKGRAVEVIDDALHPGGSLRALCPEARAKMGRNRCSLSSGRGKRGHSLAIEHGGGRILRRGLARRRREGGGDRDGRRCGHCSRGS